jgi:hypothetical protein
MAVTISWSDTSITSPDGQKNSLVANAYELRFDAVERLSLTSKAEVTSYTVESGSPLTDHKKKLPRTIVVQGRVSNTPIGAPPPSGLNNSSRVSAEIRGSNIGNLLQFSEEFDRLQDVFDSLQHLVQNGIFVTLETDQAVYDRVTVVSVEDLRTAPHYNGASFIVTFQEIFVADTQEVLIPIPAEPRGQSTREERADSAQSATPREPPRSWALAQGRRTGLFQ